MDSLNKGFLRTICLAAMLKIIVATIASTLDPLLRLVSASIAMIILVIALALLLSHSEGGKK